VPFLELLPPTVTPPAQISACLGFVEQREMFFPNLTFPRRWSNIGEGPAPLGVLKQNSSAPRIGSRRPER